MSQPDFDIQVFQFVPELDAFVCTPLYVRIARALRIVEWNPSVWIGRLFCMDNDYGEHWFDNEVTQATIDRAYAMGFTWPCRLDPDRFKDDENGPCHTPEMRRRFWSDVVRTFRLSWSTLVAQALENNEKCLKAEILPESDDDHEGYVPDIQARIDNLLRNLQSEGLAPRS